MEWVLIIVLVWTHPEQVIQVPIATKELCEQAAKQARVEFGRDAVLFKIGQSPPFEKWHEGVLTSCLEVSP